MSLNALFASAPRIKIRVNGQLVGYAIGFNVNVSVDVQPVYVLGEYAPVALEPTMYNTVSGTFQIARLRNLTVPASTLSINQVVTGVDATGKEIKVTAGDANAKGTNSPLAQSELFKQIDPRAILFSSTFDVDLYMKVPTGDDGKGTLTTTEYLWMTIKDCRITSRNTNISMNQLVNEPLNFQGLLASPAGNTTAFSLDNATVQSSATTSV